MNLSELQSSEDRLFYTPFTIPLTKPSMCMGYNILLLPLEVLIDT